MDKDIQQFELDDSLEIRNTILRYLSFWPYLIVVISIFLSVTFFICGTRPSLTKQLVSLKFWMSLKIVKWLFLQNLLFLIGR